MKKSVYDVATPYTASYVLLRRGSKVAFVLRSNTGWMDGYYGLPSGKVEKGEPFTQAAIREAREEVGVTLHTEDLIHAHTCHRDAPDSLWVDVYFEVSSWEGEPFNAEPDKHERLEWLDITDLPENVIPPVRDVLQHVAAGSPFSEYGWKKIVILNDELCS